MELIAEILTLVLLSLFCVLALVAAISLAIDTADTVRRHKEERERNKCSEAAERC